MEESSRTQNRSISYGLVAAVLLVCAIAGFFVARWLGVGLPSISTLMFEAAFLFGVILFFMSLFARRVKEMRPIQRQKALAKVESYEAPPVFVKDPPKIDLPTALIIPIPKRYNQMVWAVFIAEFGLLSILFYFVLFKVLFAEKSTSQAISPEVGIAWLVALAISIIPLLWLGWLKLTQSHEMRDKVRGRELIFDSQGVHMSYRLFPRPFQRMLRKQKTPSLLIPWKHIRAWVVGNRSDVLNEYSHKFLVAPFPALQLEGVAQLKLVNVKVLRIPGSYIEHVEDQVIAYVNTYGPQIVKSIDDA